MQSAGMNNRGRGRMRLRCKCCSTNCRTKTALMELSSSILSVFSSLTSILNDKSQKILGYESAIQKLSVMIVDQSLRPQDTPHSSRSSTPQKCFNLKPMTDKAANLAHSTNFRDSQSQLSKSLGRFLH